MKVNRIMVTLPKGTIKMLRLFAKLQDVDYSVIIQMAITKMANTMPEKSDIAYTRGQTETVQVTLSDTAAKLLDMWREKTGLSKSETITYALQQTIEKEDGGI